jgi:phosphonate transport system substrate-binding protein
MEQSSQLGCKFLFVAVLLLAPQLAGAASLNVGSISISPVVETRKFWPLANYLGQRLKSEGIDEGKVVVADSIPAMASLLQKGQADIYIDSFYPSLAVSRLAGSKLLLRRWKLGKSDYQSVIFTRKDSNISRLEDLRGKVIAFEEPFSSSGYFFPKMVLLEKGFRLAPKLQGSDPVKSDELGYIFSHVDSNTILLVLNKVAAAGAIDNQKYLTLQKNLDSLKILHETEAFPRQIVSYREDLPTKLVARVKHLLLSMPRIEEGQQVLQAFEETTKFDEIPDRDLKLVDGLRKHIDAELKLQR